MRAGSRHAAVDGGDWMNEEVGGFLPAVVSCLKESTYR